MIFLAEKMWKTNFPSVKGGTGLKIIFPPFFLVIFQGPILVLVWNDLPPKSEAQSERGIQIWRENLSATEREAAAILDSADLEYESPGKVSAKLVSHGEGCGRTELLTEDSVT